MRPDQVGELAVDTGMGQTVQDGIESRPGQ
jgi:hypothetical protein